MAWDDGIDKSSVGFQIAASKEKRIRVIAGPGTGKSFAMKRRVARLLEEGIKPREILAMTFTRVAAEDLHRELTQLGVPGCESLEGRTLHSLGLQILSRQHVLKALGRTPQPLNRFEVATLVADLAKDFNGKKQVKKLMQAYLSAWAVSQGDEPGFPDGSQEKAFAKSLVDWLNFHQSMLIGEIIPYLHLFLKNNPTAKEHSEFKHVLVDEYQDLNKAEQAIVAYLSSKADACIVGDDDQSIYVSLKHAHPEGIREWHVANPGTKDFVLSECQRCPTIVVEMANSLITFNKNRKPRQLTSIATKGLGEIKVIQYPSYEEESKGIVAEIGSLLKAGIAPGEIIVLVQRRLAAGKIVQLLREDKVPVRSFYDESQLDSETAQERFAIFKLFLNRSNRAALRYLLGAGSDSLRAAAYARIRKHCEISKDSPWEAMEKLADGTIKISHTKELVQRFEEIQDELEALKPHENDLKAFVDAVFADGEGSVSELRELALRCLEKSESPDELLREMMQELTQPEIPPTVKDVRVMSLNKSKGLSSTYVFIAGCVQGMLPMLPDDALPAQEKQNKIEEQRRLFYVAVTRVKSDLKSQRKGNLYLTYCAKMPNGLAKQAGIVPASSKWGIANLQPSIFLSELGKSAPKPVAG